MVTTSTTARAGSHSDVFGLAFDGRGGAREFRSEDLPAVAEGAKEPEFIWLHVQRDAIAGPIRDAFGVDQVVLDALTAEDTRPRCAVHGDGVIVNLRGVNLAPGAEPEDMVSVRLWVNAARVLGVWVRPLQAVQDLVNAGSRGMAPVSTGDFVARLALRLADHAEPVVASLNERMDDPEEAAVDESLPEMRRELSDIRRMAILLRRFMFPQRDALTTLEIEDLAWLQRRDRSRIREAGERVTRLGEELDAIRDRAQVIHDQIMDRRSEAINRQMLILAVVSVVFLPLGLIVGLLGINVAGIPGAAEPAAFWVVCGLLVAIGLGQVALLRWLKVI
jgi:zinc transporter